MINTSSKKTILVTGSNKGIGYAILEALLQKEEDFNLIMSTRTLSNGEKAIAELQEAYPSKDKVSLLQLDLLCEKSIQTFVDSLKEFPKIDIFINNSGVYYEQETPESVVIQWETNYSNTRKLTELALESGIVNKNGKIIFVSSELGKIKCVKE